MKNTDIAAVILIASLSMLAAYFIADAVIGRPDAETAKVRTIDPLVSDVTPPDATVFNKDAINPTVEVIIGGQSSPSGQTSGQQGATNR